jgi:peptide deformylase
MAILPIVEVPDPVCVSLQAGGGGGRRRQLSPKIDTMMTRMASAWRRSRSASTSVLVIDLQKKRMKRASRSEPRAYINPEILSVSDELSSL